MAVLRPIAIAAAALLMMGVCAYGQHTLCAGAEGKSQACCPPCSSCGANDGPGNNGQFDTGFGNQGFGNDGFNNVGDFNIGSANKGDCNLASGGMAFTLAVAFQLAAALSPSLTCCAAHAQLIPPISSVHTPQRHMAQLQLQSSVQPQPRVRSD